MLAGMRTTMQNVLLVCLCGMAAVRWPRSTICGVGSTGGSSGKLQTDETVIVATFLMVAVA